MAPVSIKVTVIIPVYNAGKLLARMLDSILAQSEQSFEIICVDDGSCDDGVTANIMKEYTAKDARMHVLFQKNSGPAAARNLGLENARGEYIYVCDQDDYLHPQLLEYCLWVTERKNVPFVAFRYARHDGDTVPSIDLLGDFGNIPIIVADKALSETSVVKYCHAHEFHTDCWVQFAKLELAKAFPFALDRGLTRPFALVRMAGRWAVSTAVLYYYNSDVSTSMMHKPIPEKTMLAERRDWIAFYDLYAAERESGDLLGVWRHQCKTFLVKGIKMELNAIRRSKRYEDDSAQNSKYAILAETLREIFIRRNVPIHYASMKHLVRYIWLLLKFR